MLIYYARILALAESLKKQGQDVTYPSLRRCVKSTTSGIIQSEFINELKSTVVNIDDILSSFRMQKNILNFQIIREILKSNNYRFAVGELEETDVVQKLKFLYEVGFLGLNLTEEQQDNLGACHKNAFVFNEGDILFSDKYLKEEELNSYSFIIHPIFCEYLHLDTKDSEFPLVFTWDYLSNAEAALRTRLGSYS